MQIEGLLTLMNLLSASRILSKLKALRLRMLSKAGGEAVRLHSMSLA